MKFILKILLLAACSISFTFIKTAAARQRIKSYSEAVKDEGKEFRSLQVIRRISSPSESEKFSFLNSSKVGANNAQSQALRSGAISAPLIFVQEKIEYLKKEPSDETFPDIFSKPIESSSWEEKLKFYRDIRSKVKEVRLKEKQSNAEKLYVSYVAIQSVLKKIRASNSKTLEDVLSTLLIFKNELTEAEFKKCEKFCHEMIMLKERYS